MTHLSLTNAIRAIGALNDRRMGIERFDAWIDYAIRDWHKFIHEKMQK
jgi:hypothetical protein